MPRTTDVHITSRYAVSDGQLIPQPTKFIWMQESLCCNVSFFHYCRQYVKELILVSSVNTNDPKRDNKDEEINSRYAVIERCFRSETYTMRQVADEDGSDYHYANDEESVNSMQEWHGIKIYNNEQRVQRRKLVVCREKQGLRRRIKINQFIASFVLFVSTMRVLLACPEIITSICLCVDSQNGIILKCSHTNGSQAIYILKANQINLGLIQHLEMQDSGLRHIPAGFFSGLFIKKLDLSHNNILDIDENGFLGLNDVLQELILHHNNLTQLPSKALTPLSALLRLDLSNNSIGDIEAQHAIPSLPKEFVAIRGLKQLMALHLHNNNISSLEALSFMNLPLVNLLNLASNQISAIHNRTFLNVPNLRYLYLTRNRINNISPYQFSSFEQLEMVDLTGNHLTELQENSFSNLKNLRQLYLGENRIKSIKPGGFADSSVVILILNSNHLEELQEGMFDGLTKLQQLGLKGNQIRSIDQNSFYSNPGLAMLDLSNNELVDVPPSTFLAQVNLFLIDLSGNKLERTPYEAFSRRVKIVLLHERVHMLQHGVGIYMSSSKDFICGPNKNQGTTDITTLMSNTTLFVVDDGDNYNFKSGEKLMPRKTLPVIRPLSSTDNKANKSAASVGEQKKIGATRVNTVRLINATKNTEPSLFLQSPHMFRIKQSEDAKGDRADTMSESRIFDKMNYENKMLEDNGIHNRNRSENHQRSFNTDDNIIHPLPVPFLKRPSKLSKAYIAVPRTTTSTNPTNRTSLEQTLPPSIVVASDVQGFGHITSAYKNERDQIDKDSMENIREAQASGKQIFFDLDSTERLERVTTPSVIILICLSTIAIVMAAVLIGLCIAKHRRLQTHHSSMTTNSAPRTNAYVAAQLDMIYGTLRQNGTVPILNRFDDGQPWIYAPTSYGTTGYYK